MTKTKNRNESDTQQSEKSNFNSDDKRNKCIENCRRQKVKIGGYCNIEVRERERKQLRQHKLTFCILRVIISNIIRLIITISFTSFPCVFVDDGLLEKKRQEKNESFDVFV